MNQEELDECFEFVSNLVKKCGEILLEGFKDPGEVSNKGAEHDLVTFYDGKIEEVLMDSIRVKYPNHKFIGEEEQSSINQTTTLTSSPTWIIDPIDGTINFVRKLHFICISVALVIDHDIKFGIIYNPTLNEYYTAQKQRGAYLNGERIYASKANKMQGSVVAHESSLGCVPQFTDAMMARTLLYMQKTIGMRSLGSAALTLGYVAKGGVDAYNIEYLKPWDIAAGALIVREAGGVVIGKNGSEYDIMKPEIIAAGTMELAMEIKGYLDEIDGKLEAEGRAPWQLLKKN